MIFIFVDTKLSFINQLVYFSPFWVILLKSFINIRIKYFCKYFVVKCNIYEHYFIFIEKSQTCPRAIQRLAETVRIL